MSSSEIEIVSILKKKTVQILDYIDYANDEDESDELYETAQLDQLDIHSNHPTPSTSATTSDSRKKKDASGVLSVTLIERRKRLHQLASEINQWEDEASCKKLVQNKLFFFSNII